jgi:hypothetical protein
MFSFHLTNPVESGEEHSLEYSDTVSVLCQMDAACQFQYILGSATLDYSEPRHLNNENTRCPLVIGLQVCWKQGPDCGLGMPRDK